MELRRFNHYHYILVIKGDLMIKVLNVNSRGKPAIVFKKLTDIYESIYDRTQESLPAQWSREGLEENIPNGCELKVETQVLYAERKLFNGETEVSDSDSEDVTDGHKSDIEADSMTLKQIMESCKKRKLRQLKPVDSGKKKLRTCSRQELNRSCLLSDEYDDFDVVLSIWKSKLSKCKKSKIKLDESRISTCLPHGQTIENSELINSDQDLLPSCSDLPFLLDIKVETPEINVKEIQNTNCIMDKLSLLCDENVNSCSSLEPIGADGLFFSGELTVSKKETEYCVLNCASHENFDGNEPGPLQMLGESSNEWKNDDKLEVREPHYSESPASEIIEGQYSSNCVSNDSISEVMSLTESGTYLQMFGTNISVGESITHEVIRQNNSEDMSEAISVTEEQCSDTYISEGNPFIHEAICTNNGEIFTHLHGMTDLNRLTEMSSGAEVHLTEISDEDKLAFDNEKGISTESTSDCNLSPEHGGSILPKSTIDYNSSPDHGTNISTNPSSDGNLTIDQHYQSIDECPAKERQPQMSDYSDSERNILPDFHLYGSMDKFNQFEEPKRHPTRILSTRTTISPTSQERLSKSMKSMRLHDKDWKTCGGKLRFNQIKYKVETAEESDHVKRVYSDTYCVQSSRKSKKRSLHTASSTKVSHGRVKNSTVQNWSDSAIAFTQRQMQDIECLALKLTTQLKSMKAIVEDRFHVEGNKATSYNFNMDEVRTSIAHSTKAEASARKWLSMMSRDCNRFCKIMKTTDHGSNASPNATAEGGEEDDEDGGKLCEAKLFGGSVNAESFVEKYETE